MTKREILEDFMKQWDKNRDGTVTFDEFVDYYNDVSASVDKDEYFEEMIKSSWKLE